MAFQKAKALQEAEKSVAQGKTAQAIRQYQEILDNDPSDVSLLNTVGDLYIRDRNITDGSRQFHRLAEAYVREGFNVKAIAIYRKISKVDPNSIDTLLKLGELYQLQGLSREAREQYLQAAEFFRKRNQTDRVLDVLRKLVQLDPENINFRDRLAVECEQSGKREDAVRTYLESADILLRREDQAGAEAALKKAAELDPQNSTIQILRARGALARQQPEEAEGIIKASPELRSSPTGKRILMEAYLGARKLPEAEGLVLEVFQATPSDFAPVAGVSALLVEKGDVDGAYRLLAGVADQVINQNNGGLLLEALRKVWSKAPRHIPTMELMHRICERTADEYTLPEVLEALGHVHEESGDLEKAEAAYLKLADREPENENYRGLLNAVKRRLGRDVKPVVFSAREMAFDAEEEEAEHQPAPGVDAQQDLMVKEALENGDLFSRYNLPEKAIAELEKVLQVYPDQIEIHRRILEISHKGFPDRAAVAAAQLARIFTAQGDSETAEKYRAIVSAKGGGHEIPPPAARKVEERAVPPPVKPAAEATAEFPISPIPPEGRPPSAPAAIAPAPPPAQFGFDLTPPAAAILPPVASAPPPAATEEIMEFDLSGDLDEFAAFDFDAPAPAFAEPEALAAEISAPGEVPAVPEESAAEMLALSAFHEELAAEPMEIPASHPELAAGELKIPVTPEPTASPSAESPAQLEEPAPAPVMEEATPPAEVSAGVSPPPPAFAEDAIPVELEDSRIEVEFYLENGFIDEARQAVAVAEAQYPGNVFVAELRRLLNERTGEADAAAPHQEPVLLRARADEVEAAAPPSDYEIAEEEAEPTTVAAEAEPEVASRPGPLLAAEGTRPPESVPVAEEPTVAEEIPLEEWELPTSYALTVEPPSVREPSAPGTQSPSPSLTRPEAPPPAPHPLFAEPATAQNSGTDGFGNLADGLASALKKLAMPGGASAPQTPSRFVAPPPAGPQGVEQLSGLLAELEDFGASAANKDDPETHYNLGVAFREMGLLDEAIGEFQKLVKGAGKGNYPTNFLQACSLLAICFTEKKMPAIAVKWYLRALETPGLDEEAFMAIQYDLGLAYEQAGDSRNALERFIEVYSQNIDFRDVAEKIRELQHKA